MARITVEDCIDKFPSRFELVLIASNRARKLHSGETPTVERDNDKNTVIALREIANETISVDDLKNDLIEEYQTTSFTEDEELIENENTDLSDANEDINNSNQEERMLEENTQLINNEDSNDDVNSEKEIIDDSTDSNQIDNSENETDQSFEEKQ